MKKPLFILLLCILSVYAFAQPSPDTGRLVEQKENVITENTIVKVENVCLNINSRLPELRPTISADGTLLFFICENHPYNTKYNSIRNSQDIWYSEKDSNGQWTEAVHMDYPLNTYFFNAVFWISPDKNTILIRNAFIDGFYAGNGVSISRRKKNGQWSAPEALRIKNFQKYDRGKTNGASMTNDGRTLLLYMTEVKGSDLNDLYVSFLQEDGFWTEPKSLGKKINLKSYDEMTPYMAADGVTMYFSSNRPGGVGDNDIWMAKRLDSSWTKWSDPVNLGEPINTPDWDAFFTMDAGGEYAYMSSALNSMGESDIVRIKLLEREKPDPVVLVSGNVYNRKTNQPLSASLIYETLPDGNIAGNGTSSPDDGSFKMVLPFDKKYSIRASADGFFAISENLNLDSFIKAGYTVIHKDLFLVPIEIGEVVRLNNVFFDFDKWDLRPESFFEINRVVKLMNENPSIVIEMGAHTDSYGSDEYNLILSGNRAKSVMDYIIARGIDPSRISSKGYGESEPVAPNDTPENRQLNRRVEFKIVSK